MASTAILSVVHGSHEDTSSAILVGTLSSQSLDLAITIDLVILENSQFGLLSLVLNLLRGVVHLLLALLGTTSEAQDEMQSGLLLDVVIRESSAILELLAGKNQSLLVGWDAFLVWASSQQCASENELLMHTLNLGLDIVDGVRGLNLKGDGFTR